MEPYPSDIRLGELAPLQERPSTIKGPSLLHYSDPVDKTLKYSAFHDRIYIKSSFPSACKGKVFSNRSEDWQSCVVCMKAP